jgi:hypothetical protein
VSNGSSKNDITMDTMRTRGPSEAYDEGWARIFRNKAPQAECAPREAQPDDDGNCKSCVGDKCTTAKNCVTLGWDAYECNPCKGTGYLPDGNHCQWCAVDTAPTPERADADTAGAKRFKRYDWNGQENEYGALVFFADVLEALSIVDETAAGASERADAGKDAALSSGRIDEIANEHFMPSNNLTRHQWQSFARAILTANKEPK